LIDYIEVSSVRQQAALLFKVGTDESPVAEMIIVHAAERRLGMSAVSCRDHAAI
jgi:hypothetical protein